ncbi:MAG: fructosamine kinase family protein, partial [Steroidobacter sp.]
MAQARHSIEAALSHALDASVDQHSARAVGGGSINEARRFHTDRGPIFVKSGAVSSREVFAAEAAGLHALAHTQTVRTPKVLAVGSWEQGAFIALEWIRLGPSTRSSEAVLGEQLAWQHRTTQPQFGWARDNTIGATPQPNTLCNEWVTFFRERRLRYQLTLATRNGADGELSERGERLCESLDAFFATYHPTPSLLHGDLWGGNWGTDEDGLPVIFDPAVYFGDREADIAMTRLFGGFGHAFYAAYQSTWPLDPDVAVRSTLYNLYHVLNHYNLFGGDY